LIYLFLNMMFRTLVTDDRTLWPGRSIKTTKQDYHHCDKKLVHFLLFDINMILQVL